MKLKYIAISTLISVVLCVLLYLVIINQQQKVAVVDAVKLFNAYHLKMEMEKEAEQGLKFYAQKLDSLSKLIQSKNSENVKDPDLIRAYQYTKELLDTEYSKSNQVINKAVWERLNPLVDEYGKEHQLHLIIGANGMGSVLYNDSYYDRTEAVINYVNKKYETGN